MNAPKRLRVAGLLMLFAGLLLAGLVFATRLPDDDEDVEFVTRQEILQMERIGGKANVLAIEMRQFGIPAKKASRTAAKAAAVPL